MASKLSSINLVQSRKSLFERFMTWAITIGRIVVIVTEGIALLAFLYRFGLDRQIIDLHDQIKQKQLVLSYLKNNEETYRNLQDRLTEIKSLGAQTPRSIFIFNDIVKLVPTGIKLNSFAIGSDSIKLDASASSINALSAFVKDLQTDKSISSVSLDRIENRTTSSTIAFGITIALGK